MLQARLVGAKGRRNAFWAMGAGRAISPARGSPARRVTMGSRGAWRLALGVDGTDKTFLHGSVLVEREGSKTSE